MQKDVNCLNTKAVIEYVLQENNGDLGDLLINLDPDVSTLDDPMKFLMDINNWISCTVAKNLFKRARLLLKDDDTIFKVGYNSIVKKRLGYIQQIFVRAFGSPISGLKRAQQINDKFNATKIVETQYLKKNKAIVRLKWLTGLDLSKDFCNINKGIYTAIPVIFKLPPAKVTETKCFFHGDEFCEYLLEWEERNLVRNAFYQLIMKKRLLKEAVEEIEKDKELLDIKYNEVYDLNKILQKKIHQLKAIQNASQAIVTLMDQRNLLDMTMTILKKILRFDRSVILLIDEYNKSLKYAYAVGESTEQMHYLNSYEIPLSRISNIMVRVANTGIPVIIDDVEDSELNQDNFILKLFKPKSFVIVPLITHNKVIGILAADRKKENLTITEDDKEYLITFANQIAIAIENSKLYFDLKESYLNSVKALVQALEAKDSYTRGHSERVTYYSKKIAERMKLPADVIEYIHQMSILHDIGKIGISENILRKKEKLSDDEYYQIKNHPEIGERILKPLNVFSHSLLYIRHHHEYFNGSGYPDGLCGKNIPVGARIICVADSYDAMTSDRPYRKGLNHEIAIRELKKNIGVQFDPEIVEVFLTVFKEEQKLPRK
jgi:HD-GYP domain-containing protein (c-di-GMP phosphodiesterase class II)